MILCGTTNEVGSGATLPLDKVHGTSCVQKCEKKDSSTTCDEGHIITYTITTLLFK